MKKVLIVAICLALVLTLVFTLGALGKKPEDKPDKPEHFIYELTFTDEMTGTVKQCGVQGGFISSSNDEEFRPNLCLYLTDEFVDYDDYEICTSPPSGRYLDLTKRKEDAISMQFFFLDPDTGKKIQLNVEDGYLSEGDEWLSPSFTIIFDDAYAVIIPTKGKRDPHWEGNVNITIHCQGK